jgi:hypothetical protein
MIYQEQAQVLHKYRPAELPCGTISFKVNTPLEYADRDFRRSGQVIL